MIAMHHIPVFQIGICRLDHDCGYKFVSRMVAYIANWFVTIIIFKTRHVLFIASVMENYVILTVV